jgi:hypothetical protein
MGDLLMAWVDSFGYQFSDLLNLLIQTVLSTLYCSLQQSFLPKVFFQIYANSLIKVFAIPAYGFYLLFYFISSFYLGF